MSAPEQLAPTDLQLLHAALEELAQAEQIVVGKKDQIGFVQAHLARVYKLEPGDGVAADGRIVRKAEEPVDA